MKKSILILLFVSLLFSCSNSDSSNSSSTNNKSFHPPSWIQGTWVQYFDNVTSGSGYKFTSDNVCQVLPGYQQCFKEMLDIYSNPNVVVTVNESINTNTEYKFSYTIQSVTSEYYFKKGTVNNTIYQISGGNEIEFTKQ